MVAETMLVVVQYDENIFPDKEGSIIESLFSVIEIITCNQKVMLAIKSRRGAPYIL